MQALHKRCRESLVIGNSKRFTTFQGSVTPQRISEQGGSDAHVRRFDHFEPELLGLIISNQNY